ncbi:hypothetical protein LPJ66_001257 [Kickxella alabastrina]|uniref:Uncharacterized protein n=1 Tax=Kickxella alabastrina TaxID=61397 RepID=A0ACC1ITR0_9FUNG|nr:hypothetical protein LPJ66_001257 [Kickxella alabastrina]
MNVFARSVAAAQRAQRHAPSTMQLSMLRAHCRAASVRPITVSAANLGEKRDSAADANHIEPKEPVNPEKDTQEPQSGDSMSSLDAVFKMLKLPDFDPTNAKAKPKKNSAQKSGSYNTKYNMEDDDNEQDIGMDDLFTAIDKNKQIKAPYKSQPYGPGITETSDKSQESDPMDEFERILSDLAAEDTQVYRSDRPAPLFWDENSGSKGSGRGRDGDAAFLKELTPESLFGEGPRTSAYSAGKLQSDPNKISSLAARIKEDTRITRISNKGDSNLKSRQRLPGEKDRRRDREIEQNQLGQLSQCRSVTALSGFVYGELLFSNRSTPKNVPVPRPSPLVFAEAIRVSRELREPQIAFFIYNYCRTHMNLADKLQILDQVVYEELLMTAWSSLRDISAVTFILQDAIAMGVLGNARLDRQIDQIIVELDKLYNMPELAERLSVLKSKISPKNNIRDTLARDAESKSVPAGLARFSLY